MTPEIHHTTDLIIRKFAEKAEKFSQKFPEEAGRLQGELTLWGLAAFESGLSSSRNTGELIKEQILAIADKSTQKEGKNISAEEVIEDLFLPNEDGKIDAEIIMVRFQLLS